MRAAFLQFAPELLTPCLNADKVTSLIMASDKWDLLVMPELASSGYAFEDREELYPLTQEVGKSPFTSMILDLAMSQKKYIVSGFPERDGDKIYNSCMLAGPKGLVGVYRKAHLFLREKEIFDPGNMEFPVFDTELGRIGMLICFDWAFPEAWRILGLKGAQIVAHPSNLVTPYAQQAVPVHALINGYYVITANRNGLERGIQFTGRSIITAPTGELLEMATEDFEGITISDAVDPLIADNKFITESNHRFEDRRLDLYGGLLF